MSKRRPLFRNAWTAGALGVVLLAGAYVCLYDAWEARGRKTPLPLRPITPW
jgi:hypothetical protein